MAMDDALVSVYVVPTFGAGLVELTDTGLQECQEIGWKDKNHKKDCKIIADSDFQEMSTMHWSIFWDFKSFPLRTE